MQTLRATPQLKRLREGNGVIGVVGAGGNVGNGWTIRLGKAFGGNDPSSVD